MNNKILMINGPNLNMLGVRNKNIYGSTTLKDLEDKCKKHAKSLNLKLIAKQSNIEGDIIKYIHEAKDKYISIIINAAAFTHTSIAIADALEIYNGDIFEVHITNIYKRESFRHNSYITPLAKGVICGAGIMGYELAIDIVRENLDKTKL